MRKKIIKAAGIFFIFLIVLNLIFLILGKIEAYIFWLVVIVCAIAAYKIIPWLKNK